MAAEAEPFVAFIDPDDPMFSQPCDMPQKIQEYCQQTRQKVPETKGSLVRTAFESLALKYKATMAMLEDLGGTSLEALHIVGGGCQNKLLNQMSADAVRRPVVTGPVEATSAGNILMQMLATGHISSLQEGRDVIRDSFETETYEPVDTGAWDAAFAKSEEVVG
jgi:sugar (pentulose or hexulose) kinase